MTYPNLQHVQRPRSGDRMAFLLRRLASEGMRSGANEIGRSRTGRRVPRRFFQSIDVLLKNSALGAKPEDETEQKCAIARLYIFMALSH
ncbi:hypothetical protein FAZ95_06925 [Trinickia violacea]|uniref:Uncharacterized protein n=1 Tax=Trinickia violacea TaxID=2571746 RepID=A0A4P8IJI6_9BURK|nr:hypothetical protein [Trinickia violacea]QCP48938.1 hypothetical protein FAZ95_06925 [Trinickia violacea]